MFLRRPIVGPNIALATEHLFAILDHSGIGGAAAAMVVDAIVLLLLGSVANDLTRPAGVRRGLVGSVQASATPRLSASIEDYASRDPEERFTAALGWLLDGVERSGIGT